MLIKLNSITESTNKFDAKCEYSELAKDQGLILDKTIRRKRFVLFPEFKAWINDWRYLNPVKTFVYWISNYYPKQIDSNHVRSYIDHIIHDINQVIDNRISSVYEPSSPDKANFHYNFFNYKICPIEDPLATTKGVQNTRPMLIYPPEIIKKNRYRAHGGIHLNHADNSTISYMKFNIHHKFLLHQDFQYEPVIYTCNSEETDCVMDLYAVMLHETLHGFGIEVELIKKNFQFNLYFQHTERNLPNKNMLAVMHLYASRIMCHDDIRAIRMVYGLPVKRENAQFDDTCRRDFPLNSLQRLMNNIRRWINRYVIRIGPSISLMVFVLTMIYIILKRRYLNRNNHYETPSLDSRDSRQEYHKQHKSAINAFLWHDDHLNG